MRLDAERAVQGAANGYDEIVSDNATGICGEYRLLLNILQVPASGGFMHLV
jgi:hypothetical protein